MLIIHSLWQPGLTGQYHHVIQVEDNSHGVWAQVGLYNCIRLTHRSICLEHPVVWDSSNAVTALRHTYWD